jgi:DNA-binding NarL/FixJ family response regulator
MARGGSGDYSRGAGTGNRRVVVALADPHPLLRTGLRAVLEEEPTIRVAVETGSITSLVAETRANAVSVAVVDCELLDSRGMAALTALHTRVLLVGETEDADRILALLTPNVRGFVRKCCTSPELISAVTAVAAGHASFPAAVTSRLLDSFVMAGGATAVTPIAELTRRERDVLRLMVDGNSTMDIARALVVQVSTVKSHIYHLLRKLGVNDRTQAVALAYRSGLLRSTIAGHTVATIDRPNLSRTAGVS